MTFLVAWRLALLGIVAAFAGAWFAALRRRPRDVVRFTDVALLDVVAPDRSAWRRHLPAALWLLALTLLVIGFARPVRSVDVARETAVVIVAIDVSLSMEADDVAPTRLAAAQEAAVSFVEDLPDSLDVGLVLFAGTATPYAPTQDHEQVIDLINRADVRASTAIGEAIFAGLELIEHTVPAAAPSGDGEDPPPAPGRIVLLGDGDTNVGRSNTEAAAAAAAAGIPVDTISFGTPGGTIVVDGQVEPVPAAPQPLRQVSATTGGEFYEAESAAALNAAYQDIGTVYATEEDHRELAGWFLGGGLLLLAAAGGLSLLWSQRLP